MKFVVYHLFLRIFVLVVESSVLVAIIASKRTTACRQTKLGSNIRRVVITFSGRICNDLQAFSQRTPNSTSSAEARIQLTTGSRQDTVINY
jgi:hypothetical protein